jgi:RNA:NAD 2'-phosphotransferase (TPT1/KptA family)
MHGAAFEFYHSEAGIWLTPDVPPEYIVFSDLSIPG